jgi:hypothetical protein
MPVMQERPLRAAVHMIKLTATQEITPYQWVYPDEERRGGASTKHRSGKCEGEQARAKQGKTGHGHSEETVRSEFFKHGTPPTGREIRL